MAVVDFLKWLNSCDESGIQQMEQPFPGVRLLPTLSDLFALAQDEAGWMLTMHADEAPWLAHLPLHSAYLGFGDGLTLLTQPVELLGETLPQTAIEIFVPELALLDLLASQRLLGFGHGRGEREAMVVTRVNRVIPLYTKARYEEARRTAVTPSATRMFAR
ncbi:MAG TPA: hypothetical protein VGD46_16185 [Rhizobacter sp.]